MWLRENLYPVSIVEVSISMYLVQGRIHRAWPPSPIASAGYGDAACRELHAR
jgi:hypothetical protein